MPGQGHLQRLCIFTSCLFLARAASEPATTSHLPPLKNKKEVKMWKSLFFMCGAEKSSIKITEARPIPLERKVMVIYCRWQNTCPPTIPFPSSSQGPCSAKLMLETTAFHPPSLDLTCSSTSLAAWPPGTKLILSFTLQFYCQMELTLKSRVVIPTELLQPPLYTSWIYPINVCL